jgi:hypothetical protein
MTLKQDGNSNESASHRKANPSNSGTGRRKLN